jgi:metal-responsive CopG/Arc/MetJ family transcriptional regulator
MKRHNFFLPDEVVEELKETAHQERTTMSDLIRKAITAYLDGRRTNSDSATGA